MLLSSFDSFVFNISSPALQALTETPAQTKQIIIDEQHDYKQRTRGKYSSKLLCVDSFIAIKDL